MSQGRSKFIGATIFLIAISCAIYAWLRMSLIQGKSTMSPFLKTLNVENFRNQTDVKCYNATMHRLTFPICAYNPQVDHLSGLLSQGKYFEADLVTKNIDFLSDHKDVTFLDLGTNLGLYSLPVALLGVHVMSVEANGDTVRRFAKSVYLGKLQDKIDVFHYAVSNERSTSFIKSIPGNIMDTFMVGNISCPGCLSVEVTTLDDLMPFVRNKKVFIKVDIQAAEIKAFTREGAGKFFKEFDVLMIQMEWVLYPERYGKDEVRRREVDRFLEFFYQRGYTDVYDPRSEKKLNSDWTRWSYDVMFKRSDLRKEKLFQF